MSSQARRIRGTAERFQVSTTTVIRWSRRYRAVQAAGRTPTSRDMADISSRPHRSPTRTRRRTEMKVKHLRTKRRFGPVQIAGRVGIPASTVHRILVREGMNRLDHMDRATGEVIRYERAHPGDLVHVDVKKFGLIPDGGGWKAHGRAGSHRTWRARNREHLGQVAARGTGRSGYAFVHSAIDDHSRLAYSEVHDDEKGATAAGFWARAARFFARPRHHCRRGHDRQRSLLPISGLGPRDGGRERPSPTHPALPTPDEREGGEIPADPAGRMGGTPRPTDPNQPAARP